MVMKEEEDNSGTGYEEGQYPFLLNNRAVLRHKANDEITHFRFIVRLQQLAKRSDCEELRVLMISYSGSNPVWKFLAKLPMELKKLIMITQGLK